jgi:hypothetical protein
MAAICNSSIPHELRCPHTPAQIRPLFCDRCTADEAYAWYQAAKASYYAGQPLVDDDREFDRWEMYMREKWPDDKRFEEVGSK